MWGDGRGKEREGGYVCEGVSQGETYIIYIPRSRTAHLLSYKLPLGVRTHVRLCVPRDKSTCVDVHRYLLSGDGEGV